LRKFNEGVNLEDIKYFCETSLAYLLDEGVTVRVSGYNKEEEEVTIDFHEKMTWNECKDHVIPLLIRVVNKYELGEFGPTNYKKNFNFCVKGAHSMSTLAPVRADIMISIDQINNIEELLNKKWNGELIMDEILFYIKSEK
jgi:hypothetical protein